MSFFPQEVHSHFKKTSGDTLEYAVSQFPVQLKRAMYAVAEKGSVGSGRWAPNDNGPGCAFYKAGEQVGTPISSTTMASRVFNVKPGLVSTFISRWDSLKMSDKGRANFLKRLLLDVGIETPPYVRGEGTKVISYKAFKGAQTKFLEQLAQVNTPADMGFTDTEIQVAEDLVRELVAA